MNGNNWRGLSWDCDDEDDWDNREDKFHRDDKNSKLALMMKTVMLFTIENWLKTFEERQMNGLLQS